MLNTGNRDITWKINSEKTVYLDETFELYSIKPIDNCNSDINLTHVYKSNKQQLKTYPVSLLHLNNTNSFLKWKFFMLKYNST